MVRVNRCVVASVFHTQADRDGPRAGLATDERKGRTDCTGCHHALMTHPDGESEITSQ